MRRTLTAAALAALALAGCDAGEPDCEPVAFSYHAGPDNPHLEAAGFDSDPALETFGDGDCRPVVTVSWEVAP